MNDAITSMLSISATLLIFYGIFVASDKLAEALFGTKKDD